MSIVIGKYEIEIARTHLYFNLPVIGSCCIGADGEITWN